MSKRKRAHPKKPSVRQPVQQKKSAKRIFSRTENSTPEQLEARERFRTRILPILILFIISFVAYANAWPNNLTWDDGVFGMGYRLSGIGWDEVGRFFSQDAWASIGLDTGLYRPLLLASVSLDIEIFGHWMAGFHLVNILFHALTTIAVYGLTRYLLVALDTPFPRASYIALLAALVFAVHPVHTEVVNSIFNRSEMLATLGTAAGLWWFLPAVEKTPRRAWGILGLIYLFAMLSRETGIVLPGIAAMLLWFTTSGTWLQRLRKCLPVLWLLVPMAVYLGMRAHALEVPMSLEEMAPRTPGQVAAVGNQQSIPILGAYLDIKKMLPAVTVWFDAFKLMLWPSPLLTFHGKSETNQWMALGAQMALLAFALFRVTQKRPGLFLGLVVFYLAMLPSSRIIGEVNLNPHLAERYLYMPSAGATIMLAFGLAWFAQKVSLKQTVISTLTALLILTPLTWVRNSKWASTALLAETDYNQGSNSPKLLQAYISALLMNNELAKASAICDKHDTRVKNFWYLASYCGQVQASLRNYEKAEISFFRAMKKPKGRSSSHYALGVMYLEMDRRDDARKHFELASETERQEFLKKYLAAEGLMRLYPPDRARLVEARSHMEKSIQLQPQYYHARQRLEDLNQILGSLGSQDN
jgi:tetratricopeptide (TPR) repeat protein